MIDIEKLKYDLAMQSALAATIINRSEGTIAAQMLKEFTEAYNEYSLMSPSALSAVSKKMIESKQLSFETVNSIGKRNI